MFDIYYYSSRSENTKNFVEKILATDEIFKNVSVARIPIKMLSDNFVYAKNPYVLFVPTYAAGDGRGALSKSIVKFLNYEENRKNLRYVIASGNINFGDLYCYGGELVAKKCNVPIIYKYELRGTKSDVERVSKILKEI